MADHTKQNSERQLITLIETLAQDKVLSRKQASELATLVTDILAAPSITHTEIKIDPVPGADSTVKLWAARKMLEGFLDTVLWLMHVQRPLAPHEQWTINLGVDCGFQGRVILQVDDLGTCEDMSVDLVKLRQMASSDKIVH